MPGAIPLPSLQTSVDRLERELPGAVVQPGGLRYEEARRVWNARVDRRPAVIVRCASARDVTRALAVARAHELPVSVRGSGHNISGHGVHDGAMTLDLRAMKTVDVDPVRRVARAQAGVTWGELDAVTCAHGLATTGARISTVGIAGVTLGGGYGWLMRQHGLTIDNVRAMDVVTAGGDRLTASAQEHAELFWALRGGGGGLGIVTAFEYDLHALAPTITCGVAYYPIARAREVLHWYRDVMGSAPDELAILFNVVVAPPAPFVPPQLRGRTVAALALAHFGCADDARRDLAALNALGPPLLESIKPRRYGTLQRLFDAAGAYGNCVYGRSGHLLDLSDTVIDAIVAYAPSLSSPLSVVMVSALGGAVARVGEHETAFSHRATRFDCAIDSVWTEPGESAAHIAWTEELWSAIAPCTSGVYVNELGDEGAARARAAYGSRTLGRLAAVRTAYDPSGQLPSRVPPPLDISPRGAG